MKKILTLLLTLLMGFTLFGCSNNSKISDEIIVDDDPLIMYVNAKERREFFLVKQYTKVSDFNPEDIIEVNINKDVDYTVEWVGERFAHQLDTYDEIIACLGDDPESEIFSSKKDTLDCESFRPISIYVTADYNGRKITKCVNTILLVVPEKLYNDLLTKDDSKRIEDVWATICSTFDYGPYPYENVNGEGVDNMQKAINGYLAGKPIEEWSTGNRQDDILIRYGYFSIISFNENIDN